MQGFPMDSHVTWTIDPDTGATMPEFDRAVTSEPLREYIKGVITNGVLPNPSNNLQVSAGTNGMTVLVNAGFCVIEGGLAIEPNTRTLEVTSADSTYDRIDTVVARWDSNDATRRVDLHIVKGVPASHPVRPTLTRNESIYELGLADVFVTKGVATITNEKITDTRMESARCGICSSISEWDTTTIYQQVQADLKQFKSSEQTAFMDWFDRMKDQLTEDAAGHLQEEVDDINKKIHTNLLNPTLQTTTINGVTCTNNGDGTYTLNGHNEGSTEVYFNLMQGRTAMHEGMIEKIGKNLQFSGVKNGSTSTFSLTIYFYDSQNQGTGSKRITDDIRNNVVIPENSVTFSLGLRLYAGATATNVVIKPMLTTDLSATYDDFVQYSGDGELNQNVADIYDRVGDVEDDISTLHDDVTSLNEKVGSASLLPNPSQSVTQNINTLNSDLSDKAQKAWTLIGAIDSSMTVTIPTDANEVLLNYIGVHDSIVYHVSSTITKHILNQYPSMVDYAGSREIQATANIVNRVVLFTVFTINGVSADSKALFVYYR